MPQPRGNGRWGSLFKMLFRLLSCQLRPQSNYGTRMVNAASLGGPSDQLRRPPIVVEVQVLIRGLGVNPNYVESHCLTHGSPQMCMKADVEKYFRGPRDGDRIRYRFDA